MKLKFWGKTKELKNRIAELEQELEEANRDKIAINNDVFNFDDIHRVIFKTDNKVEGTYSVVFSLKTNGEKYETLVMKFKTIDKLRDFQEFFINTYHINWFQYTNDDPIANTQWY